MGNDHQGFYAGNSLHRHNLIGRRHVVLGLTEMTKTGPTLNEISPAASRKLAKLKRPYDLMSPDEQLAYTIALRARRRAPERPIRVKAAKPTKVPKPASKGKANAEIKAPKDQPTDT